MASLLHFFKYNNTVPILLGVIFLGTGSAFAAANPDAIVSSQQKVVAGDNSYVINADIANRDFKLAITNVTEDADNYYITYQYQTIAPLDYVWQEKPVGDTLTFSKKEVQGLDLGLFAAKQLGQIIDHEQKYLLAVQTQEREKGKSLKTVATAYSGLVGRFFDSKEETFPGYTPVVAAVALADDSTPVGAAEGAASNAAAAAYVPDQSPRAPTQEEVQAMISSAVNNILSQKLAQGTATSTTPVTPAVTIAPANPPPVDLGSPPAITPPADTPPDASSTPSTPIPTDPTSPPVDTSTPPTPTPSDTIPPPTPDPTPAPTPAPTPDPTPAPTPDTSSAPTDPSTNVQ